MSGGSCRINSCDNLKVSWEPNVAKIIRDRVRERETIRKATTGNPSSKIPPFVVGLVGIPGSGKSTSARILSSLLLHCEQNVGSNESIGNVIFPMDGYHYSLKTLRSLPNPDSVIYRRGAPDTFDSKSFWNDLGRIMMKRPPRHQHDHVIDSDIDSIVKIPGFDHARGDPQSDAYTFDRNQHSVVICEGLYLLHDSDGWEEGRKMIGAKDDHIFDLTVFLDCSVDESIRRLKDRNTCIPGYTKEEIEKRCDVVDRANALTVLKGKGKADLVVKSMAAGEM